MYIGGGISLLVVGAILTFGVRDNVEALDLSAIGWICMAAGAFAVVLSLVLSQQRNNSRRTEVVERREQGGPPPGPGPGY